MQKSTGVFSVMVATMLLASACRQGENTVGQRPASMAARTATTASTVDGAHSDDALGKKGDGVDDSMDDTAGKGVDDSGKGFDDAGKGVDDSDKGIDDSGKGDVVVVVGGKSDGDSDSHGKGGDVVDDDDMPGQAPGQAPNQAPTQTVVQTKTSSTEQPTVMLQLPAGACKYLASVEPTFVIKKDQFGPNLPPLDVVSANIQASLKDGHCVATVKSVTDGSSR